MSYFTNFLRTIGFAILVLVSLSYNLFSVVSVESEPLPLCAPGKTNTPANPCNPGTVTASQAQTNLDKQNSLSLDNALNSVIALPETIFPNCVVKQSTDKTKNTDKLIPCLKDIVNIVFIVAVLWVIIDIASSNLGVILRSGEGGKGDGPVAGARRKIEKALIGLAMIGGIGLILNLFASNLINFNLTPLSQLPDIRSPTLTISTNLNVTQDPYYNNLNNGTSRTDIQISDTDFTTLDGLDYVQVSRWVDVFIQNSGVQSPTPGTTWVFKSHGTTQINGSKPVVPLHIMLAVAKIESKWGGSTDPAYACATQKLNMFGVPLTPTAAKANTELQAKIKAGTAVDCDYKVKYGSYEESINGFINYYNSNLASKSNCDRWEKYSTNINFCALVKQEIGRWESFILTQNPKLIQAP
jgi:hypothetical protein